MNAFPGAVAGFMHRLLLLLVLLASGSPAAWADFGRRPIELARERGAREIHVDSGDAPGPNLLYDTVGFTEKYRARVVEKRFD